jgi:nucleoside-diphosphate-sugar epimerase
MRLLRINVIANHVLLQRLSRYPLQKYFCVSSDKAVNPGSLMGASKAFMERVCLAHAMSVPFSTARFANVAFSDGSLLESFYQRLESGQPLAGPIDVRRYFISHQEAGELCLLAGFIAGNREIFTPKMDAEKDLKSFPEIATAILRSRGLKPLLCHSAKEAIEYAKRRKPGTVEWPCFFAPSDTGGEKPFEEFYADSETVAHDRFANIAVVTHPRTAEAQALFSAVDFLESLRQRGDWRLGELLKVVRSVIPEFKHIDGELDLDRKL